MRSTTLSTLPIITVGASSITPVLIELNDSHHPVSSSTTAAQTELHYPPALAITVIVTPRYLQHHCSINKA